jgi:hypothetical protein
MPWPAAYITDMFESEFPAHTYASIAAGAKERRGFCAAAADGNATVQRRALMTPLL